MSQVKSILLRIWHLKYMKYIVVTLLGVLIVGFLDENSVWNHVRNTQRIKELKAEIAKHDADYRRDQSQLRLLETDPKAMEKIARERYFMKADDEDIFVLSDDARSTQPISQAHETAQ